ncbi:PEP-CTERM sorting domain-containing protein [Microbacterium ureisolvens]|uniref:PEP-CTERM sorting domain-containing protein n=1 Tax=Microbacterium ureisolvens TaxID=2781186 RepID=UPI00362FF9CA
MRPRPRHGCRDQAFPPEPGTASSVSAGLAGLAGAVRRRRRGRRAAPLRRPGSRTR